MVKTLVITLTDTIGDDALSATASVTVNGTAYNGKVTAIITHEAPAVVPPTSTVTLKGSGLEVA